MVRGTADVTTEGLQVLYEAKARAELAQADALYSNAGAVASWGDPLAAVVLVVGAPGPEELAAHRALAGPVGEAARKAIGALGFDPASTLALCSRPGGDSDQGARAERLEYAIEAVDPVLVVALDPQAAEDLARAVRCPRLAAGRPVTARGRTIGAVGDLAASLRGEGGKRAVWAAFLSIASAVPPGMRRIASKSPSDAAGTDAR
jgi:hypothetical protein